MDDFRRRDCRGRLGRCRPLACHLDRSAGVAAHVIVALSIMMVSVRAGSWVRRVWEKWDAKREAREQRLQIEANRKLLDLPEMKEAILAARSTVSQNRAALQ